MFTMEVDEDQKLIRARMSGFMDPAEVLEFSQQEQQAVTDMGCNSGDFILLIDTDGAVIQSQETVAKFIEIMASSQLKARKIAVVRKSSLSRMQTQRILLIRDNAAIFPSVLEAEAWLLSVD
ncbi:MAG: hypothetical protein PW790_04005 [Parvibaculaceae bacterium]|nr:hypothetical protein [Parvibaculaceae bacterium]